MRSGRAAFPGLVYLQLAAGMIVFGSATPVSKLVTGAMPVFVGSGFRVAIGALVLLPLVMRHGAAIKALSRRDWLLTFAIAVFGMFGFSALMLMGMTMISGVAGSVVMATTPAVTAAAAIAFMREQATWRKLAALALAVAGVLLLHLTGGTSGGAGTGGVEAAGIVGYLRNLGPPAVVGSMLVFGAVCCEAAYTLLGRRVSRTATPVVVAFLAAALSLPLFLPLAAMEWQRFEPATIGWPGWAAMMWYGAGTLALGTWLWYSGIVKTQGSIAAAFMGLMPVSALVLSYVLLGESFAWAHLLGFGTVFAGVLLMSWEHARMSS